MISENLSKIRQRIISACKRSDRQPSEITVVAVTKSFGTDAIREAVSQGIYDIGENYVQELLRKRSELGSIPVRWHFIGHLQHRKIKNIADWIHLIQTVDSLKLGIEISKQAEKIKRIIIRLWVV